MLNNLNYAKGLIKMKKIPLTQGKVAIIDDEDFEKISMYPWHASKKPKDRTWYATAHVRMGERPKAFIRMHRFILGEYNPKVLIDHKDRNGLNNQKSNLRRATISQNRVNSGKQTRNKGKYKGVYPQGPKWRARLRAGGVDVYIGTFNSEDEAARAYNKDVAVRYGEFAVLNKVPYFRKAN